MFWDTSTLADDVARVIAAAEADLRLEQAVYGLDSMEELPLQKVLADGLARSYSVAREVHYPSSKGNKLTHRRRCDLVLTPPGRPLRVDHAPASLFDAPDQAGPEDAMWVEVKCAYQFRAVQTRHGGYGAQWRGGVVDDLKKMEAEPLIKSAALLLVVFTESQAIVEKDLELFEDVLVRKEVLAGFRQVRHISIIDRMGHAVCTAALWPTIQR
jgi:hypothetical protein